MNGIKRMRLLIEIKLLFQYYDRHIEPVFVVYSKRHLENRNAQRVQTSLTQVNIMIWSLWRFLYIIRGIFLLFACSITNLKFWVNVVLREIFLLTYLPLNFAVILTPLTFLSMWNSNREYFNKTKAVKSERNALYGSYILCTL